MEASQIHESRAWSIPEPRLTNSRFLLNTIFGSVLRLSGQLPYEDGEIRIRGTVGRGGLSAGDAAQAARLCALNSLAVINHELGGFDSVQQILRMTVYIAASPEFVELPGVADAASEIYYTMLGDRGRHARSAVAVSALPKGAPVEIEVDVALNSKYRQDDHSDTGVLEEG